MADHESLLSEFQSVTGAEKDRAKFYLESANWQLHVALSSFFDNDGDDSAEIIDEPEPVQEQPPGSQMKTRSQQQQKQPKSSSRPRRSNVTTFGSLKDDDSSSSEEGEAFYAGGSERSGQQIIGPGKKVNSQKMTEALFEAAKQHGAEVVDQEQERNDAGRRKKAQRFGGSGNRLGSETESSSSTASAMPTRQSDEVKMVTFNLKFWSDGFSVNDGPLRSFDDPDNKEFLASIQKGEIPEELAQNTRGAEVHVNMEDHRTEEYEKPKLRLQAFSGQGQMLGNPTPQIVSNTQPQALQEATPAAMPPAFCVDPTQPVTTVQIRLADGTRLVSKFNHSSTVSDILNLVRNARPNTGNFVLMTTFPTREITDFAQSLTDAGLLNATIVQRLK